MKQQAIRTAVLLGTQRFEVTLDSQVKALHDGGPMAAITSGWQEREEEDDALRRHVGVELVNLRLRQRQEQVFQVDEELREAHRQRQQLLRQKQEFYRIRLQFALEAHRVIRARTAPQELQEREQGAALAALQTLDEYHCDACVEIYDRFEVDTNLFERPEVVRHREEIRQILQRCKSVAISGGHVAAIINRLAFFGITDMLDQHVIFAWSAGAMAITDRVVLYHDRPPQGPGAAEVLTRGQGWVPDMVVLPEPEKRLRMTDRYRVGILAARFSPARCMAFPAAAHLVWQNGRIVDASGVIVLHSDGRITPLEAS